MLCYLWAVPDSAFDFVSDKISRLLSAALDILLGPCSGPDIKGPQIFFAKRNV